MNVYFTKLSEKVKLPIKKNINDGGFDIFWNPKSTEVQYLELNGESGIGTIIKPNESKLFSTGWKICIPSGYLLKIDNRSSIASKKKLIIGATIVDCGYDKEVFVNLINVGNDSQLLLTGERIAQCFMLKHEHFDALELNDTEFNEQIKNNLRLGDGFGSSGRF